MKNNKETITRLPAYSPDKVVFTPLALLTAPLANGPFIGKDCANELAMLQRPTAINSCVASMALPLA